MSDAADDDRYADATAADGEGEQDRYADAPSDDGKIDSAPTADLAPFDEAEYPPRWVRGAVQATWWALYLPSLCLLQVLWRALRYRFFVRESVGSRLTALLRDAARAARRLVFLGNSARAVLYLRSSVLITPGSVLPFLPGARVESADPSASRDGMPPNWDGLARTVRQRDDFTCLSCGARGGPRGDAELHVDHATPRSRGGEDHPANLRTLCRACHEARHGRRFE